MISVLVLLLLPALLSGGATLPLARINWTACDVNACVPLGECTNKVGADGKLAELLEGHKVTNLDCEVGVHTQLFSQDVALIKLQVINKETSTPSLSLHLNEKELFGCQQNGSGGIQLSGDEEIRKKYKIELFEDRSVLQPKHAPCAVTVEKYPAFVTYVNSIRRIPEMKFYKEKYTADASTSAFFRLPKKAKCDFFSIQNSMHSSLDDHVLQIKNKDEDKITCQNYGESYSLKYQDSAKVTGEMEELECKFIGDTVESGEFEAFMVFKNDTKPVDDLSQTYIYCAAPSNEVCEKPSCTGKDCPQYTPGKKGQPAKYTCPDKKWIINGEYVTNEQPECKQDAISNPEKVAFFIGNDKIENARCFKDYDCKKKSKLDYPDCADESTCDMDYSDAKMRCKDGKKQLRVYRERSDSLNSSYFTDGLSCDKNSGAWQDENETILADGWQVRCISNETYTGTGEVMTTGEMIGWIAASIVGSILFTVAVMVAIYFWYYPPSCWKVKGKRNWMNTNDTGRVAYCQMMFGQVTQATTDTSNRIVHGLKLIHLLLETETVDPACWEHVWPFLMRLQGTMRKMDAKVPLALSRYLYLQAKKIIDKHGWLSPKPITNLTKKKKGLIRAVAVKMLSFAIDDDDARKFVLRGFRKLGFDAVEQYPHCGLLWSVVTHCRTAGFVGAEGVVEHFDRTRIATHLDSIAFAPKETVSMPEEHVIPEFGSPSQQAAFALGGVSTSRVLNLNSTDIIYKKDSSMALSFFGGMGASLTRNPAPAILVAFGAKEDLPEEEVFTSMKKAGDVAVWTKLFEGILKILVCYGRGLDAKKLQSRFVPDATQLINTYNQLKVDQQLFEEAAEAQVEELRSWLADNIDLKELKKRPVYIKERAAIPAPPKPKDPKESTKSSKKKRNAAVAVKAVPPVPPPTDPLHPPSSSATTGTASTAAAAAAAPPTAPAAPSSQ